MRNECPTCKNKMISLGEVYTNPIVSEKTYYCYPCKTIWNERDGIFFLSAIYITWVKGKVIDKNGELWVEVDIEDFKEKNPKIPIEDLINYIHVIIRKKGTGKNVERSEMMGVYIKNNQIKIFSSSIEELNLQEGDEVEVFIKNPLDFIVMDAE